MNRDQVQGSWMQLRGEAKRLWGALTNDDFMRAEGSSDKLVGIIRQRFGDATAEIRTKLGL